MEHNVAKVLSVGFNAVAEELHITDRSPFHSTRQKVRHHVTRCLAKACYQTQR